MLLRNAPRHHIIYYILYRKDVDHMDQSRHLFIYGLKVN